MKKMLLVIILSFLFSQTAHAQDIIETKAGEPLFDKCIHPIILGSLLKPYRCFDNEYNPLNATVKAYRYNYLSYEKQLYFIGTFIDGHLNGEVTIFKQDGSKNVFNFKDHKLNGTAELYDNFGRIRKIINFVDGFMDGKITIFDEDGNKTAEQFVDKITNKAKLVAKGRIRNTIYYNQDGTPRTGKYKLREKGNLKWEGLFFAGTLFELITYKNNGDIDIKTEYAFGIPFEGFCNKEITNANGQREIKKIEYNSMHLYKIKSWDINPCETLGGINHGI